MALSLPLDINHALADGRHVSMIADGMFQRDIPLTLAF
jgi:hypothetical protein